ncbi:flavin reductase family protein [Altererythrobacter sp. KTW20L]|uniref:flavin reductase family protein n=1 Tax=Altererythrobacter sp. KTW20L TaxID=2942210 RepID=UPI0020BD862A|nr:flavin reductase family protein [Altererythrobacter sp. KTW20L]MCL6251129.1 flavin reductase family protein [Altererythrobacter sp. KTW20L]
MVDHNEIPQDRDALLTAFRDAMRHVAATVYAITTIHAGQRYGILATAVSSLSFDPPSLLVCINRAASLHGPLLAEQRFGVNVLGLGNRDVAEHFMSPSATDRFSLGAWEELAGVPVLATAQSSFACSLVHAHDFGTHSIFIGELLAAHHRQDATPLTYFDRNYIDISEAPGR